MLIFPFALGRYPGYAAFSSDVPDCRSSSDVGGAVICPGRLHGKPTICDRGRVVPAGEAVDLQGTHRLSSSATMGAAALFCAGNDNAVLDGPDRTEALGKLEFIVDLVVDVDTVAVIVKSHSGKNKPYVVLAMNDGSHLCSCRTLQILGLCCRHFWMAMRLSCKFRFHIGILNQNWLVEQGRRPMTDWPATVAPKWAIARNHAARVEDDAVREAPVVPTGGQTGR